MRFSRDLLIAKALRALEEEYERADKGPIEKSLLLRFLLAYLACHMAERWPCDEFWKAATTEPGWKEYEQFGRRQSLLSAINGIYHQLKLTRPPLRGQRR